MIFKIAVETSYIRRVLDFVLLLLLIGLQFRFKDRYFYIIQINPSCATYRTSSPCNTSGILTNEKKKAFDTATEYDNTTTIKLRQWSWTSNSNPSFKGPAFLNPSAKNWNTTGFFIIGFEFRKLNVKWLNVLGGLRFSQRCCWQLKSSGMLSRAHW